MVNHQLQSSLSCFFVSANFFQNQLIQKILSGGHQGVTVWIQIRTDVLLGLIRFQTVCKGYQQTTLEPGLIFLRIVFFSGHNLLMQV